MRGIDRFELMNKVASELQARMTFDDIARYVSVLAFRFRR